MKHSIRLADNEKYLKTFYKFIINSDLDIKYFITEFELMINLQRKRKM